MLAEIPFATLTADEAVAQIQNGMTVAVSGFTAAGSPKTCGRALAARARAEHEAGRPFRVRLFSGASTGPALDDELASADALSFRFPYQSDPRLRRKINAGEVDFFDLHLSHVPQYIEYGFLGEIDVAIVEAVGLTADGKVYLTTSGGASPSYLHHARKVIIEINSFHHPGLRELHDVFTPGAPPRSHGIAIFHPLDRAGTTWAEVDPQRILGVVLANEADECAMMEPHSATHAAIAGHVVDFLAGEMQMGRMPAEFLPVQSGVGNTANAVLGALGADARIPRFWMFTEVFQDACLELLRDGRMLGASTCALTLSPPALKALYADFADYADKLVIRPQAVSNHPELVRRLGVISINTALEVDIYGNVNSTHIAGTQLMNGIGGSGDFTRNAYISIFTCPSVTKQGKISTVVPMVSHCDHNEHSVQVVVTEHGLADLRAVAPARRPDLIIERCADPAYRPLLRDYLRASRQGHLAHDLRHAFDFHLRYIETGTMQKG